MAATNKGKDENPATAKHRLVFFGSPDFALPVLRTLMSSLLYDIVGVFTQPDKPVGRGRTLQPTPVKHLALEHGLPVFSPVHLQSQKVYEAFLALRPTVGVTVAYGKILPAHFLHVPAFGMVNVHPSLLPALRGPSPIQFAIWEGLCTTGVSLMLMDEGVDTGPLLHQSKYTLGGNETYPRLAKVLSHQAAADIAQVLPKYLAGTLAPRPQSPEGATYSRLLTKEDGLIDPQGHTAGEIERQIRALQPWPGTFLRLKHGPLKVLKAHVDDSAPLLLRCQNDTVLALDMVQLPGKKPILGAEYFRAYGSLSF